MRFPFILEAIIRGRLPEHDGQGCPSYGVQRVCPGDSNRMRGEFHSQRKGDLEDGLKAGLGTGGQRFVEALPANARVFGHLGHPCGAGHIRQRQQRSSSGSLASRTAVMYSATAASSWRYSDASKAISFRGVLVFVIGCLLMRSELHSSPVVAIVRIIPPVSVGRGFPGGANLSLSG